MDQKKIPYLDPFHAVLNLLPAHKQCQGPSLTDKRSDQMITDIRSAESKIIKISINGGKSVLNINKLLKIIFL